MASDEIGKKLALLEARGLIIDTQKIRDRLMDQLTLGQISPLFAAAKLEWIGMMADDNMMTRNEAIRRIERGEIF